MDEVIEGIILQMTVHEDRLANEFRDRRQVSFPFEYLVVAADLDGDRSERYIVATSEIDRLDDGRFVARSALRCLTVTSSLSLSRRLTRFLVVIPI